MLPMRGPSRRSEEPGGRSRRARGCRVPFARRPSATRQNWNAGFRSKRRARSLFTVRRTPRAVYCGPRAGGRARGGCDRAGLAASARAERGSDAGATALRRRSPRRAISSCRISARRPSSRRDRWWACGTRCTNPVSRGACGPCMIRAWTRSTVQREVVCSSVGRSGGTVRKPTSLSSSIGARRARVAAQYFGASSR